MRSVWRIARDMGFNPCLYKVQSSYKPGNKTIGGNGGIAPTFLISELDEDEWSASRHGRFTHGAPGTHLTEGWVGSRTDVETVEIRKISYPCRESIPGRPAGSQSLYRLSNPASENKHTQRWIHINKQYKIRNKMKSFIYWDIKPYSPLKVNRRFGVTYSLYLQDPRIIQTKKPEWSTNNTHSTVNATVIY
jgi:hypothetical protein